MTRIVFEVVRVKHVRRYVNAAGRRCQETRTFEQTINPWNKHANGLPKTAFDIRQELLAERNEWLASLASPEGAKENDHV